MYYGAAPPSAPPVPPVQQPAYQPAAAYPPPAARGPGGYGASTAGYASAAARAPPAAPPAQPMAPPPQFGYGNGYSYGGAAGPGLPLSAAESDPAAVLQSVPRVNPDRAAFNTVTLLGTVRSPKRSPQGRSASATIYVPFSKKAGGTEFVLEAWDGEAAQLLVLDGQSVVVEGRLAADGAAGAKVVAYRLKLVDRSAPPTALRAAALRGGGVGLGAGAAGLYGAEGGEGGTARAAAGGGLDGAALYKIHYDTAVRTCRDLAAKQGLRSVEAVRTALLGHAFATSSPLHWRELAEEAGLGGDEMQDVMYMVTEYKEDMQSAAAAVPPGAESAAPPLPPLTKEGMLRVRPIRDWAKAKPPGSTPHYVMTELERKKPDPTELYAVLKMAVVAEATQGSWSPEVEFGGGNEARV
ncbi:hypothetical protein HXX76_004012 [Chlamydomonas incerta]|uniref:Uncharacterized protein n=1 Tax=Chlamydomonas incerta TaxID=51695 RepID=A0A835W6G4_CHLIN|nr:hypothetical protein HXX76_004012 [Chlamydomonas incerta]|eukprot:KAG2441160.1 hypothetical protein HXX76_004012 [Chlamydomonas incerta]